MGHIVDGRQWLEQRIRFLEQELRADPEEGVRQSIELELAALRSEISSSRRRWRRWLLWGGRTP